jgi:murein DD-endopeptidase MepM/ murein hydrolase activator NlpD
LDLLEQAINGLKGDGLVTDKTLAWGKQQEKYLANEKNFINMTRIDTEKKVADMEAQGLKTDKLNKKLTDLRNKYNCNRPLNQVESSMLNQYKDSLKIDDSRSSGIVKPIKDGRITDGYLTTRSNHFAIDIGGVEKGTEIRAAKSGTVVDVLYQAGYYDKDGKPQPGAGRYAIVQNKDKTYSYYMHMDSSSVEKGQTINAGRKIGTVGNSGSETLSKPMGPHLHYEERNVNWTNRNPIEITRLYK